MDEKHANGRTWNGYVCPACRMVFRVSADFGGTQVICPSCRELLQLPKTPDELQPLTAPGAPAPPAAEAHARKPIVATSEEEKTEFRNMLSTGGGRVSLLLIILTPVAAALVVLILFPLRPSAVPPDLPVPEPRIARPDLTNPALGEEIPTPPTTSAVTGDLVTPPPVLANEEPAPQAAADQAMAPPPPPAFVPEPEPMPAPEAPPAPPAARTPVLIHSVASGQTLADISLLYGIAIDEIRQSNALENDAPNPGRKLKIPGGVAPAPKAVIANTAPQQPATSRFHTVTTGDTLERIARKYRVKPRDLMQANRMKTDVVQLGRKLVIPPAAP